MMIETIRWNPPVKDYSAKLAQCKAEMGRSYKLHPDHDPLDFPWQYEPWRLDIIEANRKVSCKSVA